MTQEWKGERSQKEEAEQGWATGRTGITGTIHRGHLRHLQGEWLELAPSKYRILPGKTYRAPGPAPIPSAPCVVLCLLSAASPCSWLSKQPLERGNHV